MEAAHSLLSPKVAARALGVSESSLKRWCDRGLIESVRTAGGHRKISAGEIIHFSQQHGGLLADPEQLAIAQSHLNAETISPNAAIQFADQLLQGDSLSARQTIVDLFLNEQSLEVLFDQVIADAFRIIGERWSCQSVDVYQERRGCMIVLSILQELKQYLRVAIPGRLAIGGTSSGDEYEIPSAMAELILRENRYETQNLGTSLPFSSFANAIRDLRPQLFWLSVSHISDEEEFIKGFATLSSTCAEFGTALVVGGRVLSSNLRPRMIYSSYCDTMQQLATFAKTLQRSQSDTRTRGPKKSVRVPNAMRRTARKAPRKRR